MSAAGKGMVMRQMNTNKEGTRAMFMWLPARLRPLALGFLVVGMSLNAYGGLSQPGMVIVGTVRDAGGTLLTQGNLSVTFTPVSGGTVFTKTFPLASLDYADGPLSYTALIPFEIAETGSPVSATALALSAAPVVYTRVISVAGTAIGRSDTVTVSTADIGMIARVDLPKTQSGAEYHSGDTNQDHRFELLELLREIDLFTSTADHSYHCDALGEDGFALGAGDHNCTPHSGDFEPRDWVFSLSELLRMIELYSGTGDHAYHPDVSGPDGFAPGAAGTKSAHASMKSGARPDYSALAMLRTVKGSGDALDVTIAFDGVGDAQVTAMGLEERVTPGWSFVGIVGGDAPSVLPRPGTLGSFEFAWLQVPSGAGSFTYRVAQCQHAGRQTFAFFGEGLYRLSGVKDTVRVPVTTVTVERGDRKNVPPSTAPMVQGAQRNSGAGNGSAGLVTNAQNVGLDGDSDGEGTTSGADASNGATGPRMPISLVPTIILATALVVLAARRIRQGAR